MPVATTVLLADKHALTVAGIKAIVDAASGLQLVGEVEDRIHLQAMTRRLKPSVLIADYTIPGYLTAADIGEVRSHSPATQILLISSTTDKARILEVLQHGIKGYVTKECSREEILAAIDAVSKGGKFYCHRVLDVIMEKHFPSAGIDSLLTNRESEILGPAG